jgi:low affinity Fe/Cu permease
MEAAFDRFTAAASAWLIRPFVILAFLTSIAAWVGSGPVFGWSPDWLNVGNAWMSAVTFAMAFIILRTGSRSEAAVQIKLDELIRVTNARNDLIAVEQRTAAEIAAEAKRLRAAAGKGG